MNDIFRIKIQDVLACSFLDDLLGRFFLTDGFLPEVSQDWDQLLTNGFLHRVPGGL